MNSWSRLAALWVAVVASIVAQTAPPQPAPSKPATPEVVAAPPVASGSASENTDLTFKPEVEPTPPTPVKPNVKPTADPDVPATDGKPAASKESAKVPEKARPAVVKPGAAAVAAQKDVDSPEYVIGPLDVVNVTVWDNPNLTGSYPVGPDGRMSMLLIGSFRAAGLTSTQLGEVVADKLKENILEPVVNAQVVRFNSKKYTMLGGVGKSGPYQLVQETTILDALAAAGGFHDFANKKKITLRRGTKIFKFNYNEVIKGKNLSQNIVIEDGDVINVPE